MRVRLPVDARPCIDGTHVTQIVVDISDRERPNAHAPTGRHDGESRQHARIGDMSDSDKTWDAALRTVGT